MTTRERFLAAMNFRTVDRLPMIEWATWWDKTLEAWQGQGLEMPREGDLPQTAALQRQFGLDVIEQFWVGFTTEDTPQPAYHGAPRAVDRADYRRIRPTLYPEAMFDEEQLRRAKARQEAGESVLWLTLEGPFWGPRNVMGIEPHLYGFYDEADWMREINEDICAYNLRVIEAFCAIATPDFMTFAEDMSYNLGPMISEACFDEFMLPIYGKIVPELKRRGILVMIDSDGDVTQAADWFARAGIEGILPLERQAGVDLEGLRARHPRMRFIGHFDKMTMPLGEAAMRMEFERLLPMMRKGGFLPSVDHQTPPGCTLENYRVYLKLLEEYARRAAE